MWEDRSEEREAEKCEKYLNIVVIKTSVHVDIKTRKEYIYKLNYRAKYILQ